VLPLCPTTIMQETRNLVKTVMLGKAGLLRPVDMPRLWTCGQQGVRRVPLTRPVVGDTVDHSLLKGVAHRVHNRLDNAYALPTYPQARR